jgi:hypothetical protein
LIPEGDPQSHQFDQPAIERGPGFHRSHQVEYRLRLIGSVGEDGLGLSGDLFTAGKVLNLLGRQVFFWMDSSHALKVASTPPRERLIVMQATSVHAPRRHRVTSATSTSPHRVKVEENGRTTGRRPSKPQR